MALGRSWTLLLVVALLTGCGSDPEPTPATSGAQGYFDGVATQSVESLQRSIDTAQPGSPAAAYATYLQASAQAALDGGAAPSEHVFTAKHTSTGYRFCQGDGSDRTCFDYTHVEVVGGKVVSFSVNDKPIAPRVTAGSGEVARFKGVDATASFVASYDTTSSDLVFVVVRVTAGAGPVGKIGATYRSPGGTSASSTMAYGPGRLAAGSSANYAFSFAHTDVGGTVTLTAPAVAQTAPGTVSLATR
jgi:hypothetical protein